MLWLGFVLIILIIIFDKMNSTKKSSDNQQIYKYYAGGIQSFILIHEVIKNYDVDEELFINMKSMDLATLQSFILNEQLLSQRKIEKLLLMDHKTQLDLIMQ